MSAPPSTLDDPRIAGDGWITVEKLSEVIDVKESTIRSWIRRGQAPPHYKLGSLVRFKKPEIRLWLADRHRRS